MTRILNIVLIFVCIASMASCSHKEETGISAPKLDFSTPSDTVKSYMHQQFYSRVKSVELLNGKIFFKSLDAELTEYEAFWKKGNEDVVVDKIEEKKDSAIIKVSYLEASERAICDVYLEKVGNEWKITEIRAYCRFCKHTGKEDDYESKAYPFGKKTCTFCKGKGWSKISYLPSLKY